MGELTNILKFLFHSNKYFFSNNRFLKALPNFAPGPNKDFSRIEANTYKTVPRISKANGKALAEKVTTTKVSPTKKKITLYTSTTSLSREKVSSGTNW